MAGAKRRVTPTRSLLLDAQQNIHVDVSCQSLCPGINYATLLKINAEN